MLNVPGQKPFMLHETQVFPQQTLYKAYNEEEVELKEHFKCVPISDISANANIISSHTIYKIKFDENDNLRLKGRIAPHGNEDSQREELRSDCTMCAPVGIRVVATVATIRHWRITKADVKTAFHKTGKADCDVFVVPPRECKDKRHYWLLQVLSLIHI